MSDRPRWQVPVLVLAILLVVGQVIVYFAVRGGSKDAPHDAGPVAVSAPLPQGSTIRDADALPPPQPQTPVIDASTEVSTPDATPEATVEPDPVTEPTVVKKKVSRAELLAQKKKERDEQERIARERDAREAQQRKAEADKAAADKARVDAELEKQRLATRKAEAEAAEAKAAAEKARIDALAQQKPVEPLQPAVTAKPAPDVLVLVLGPGTPSLSSEQIRAVFLGNTSVWPNGTTARPFNRPGGTVAARKFYGGILRMSAGDFREHWSEIQLAGNGIPPPLAGSGANTIAKVSATQGGFSYVMESELPANTNGVRLVRLK